MAQLKIITSFHNKYDKCACTNRTNDSRAALLDLENTGKVTDTGFELQELVPHVAESVRVRHAPRTYERNSVTFNKPVTFKLCTHLCKSNQYTTLGVYTYSDFVSSSCPDVRTRSNNTRVLLSSEGSRKFRHDVINLPYAGLRASKIY